ASAITLTTGLNATWRPRSWFSATGQAGLNVISRRDALLRPAGLVTPTDSGNVAQGNGRSWVGTFNVQGTVRRNLGLGFIFEANAGGNLTTTTTTDLVSSATGLIPGTSSLIRAARFTVTEQERNASVFGWYVEPRVTGRRLSLSTGIR